MNGFLLYYPLKQGLKQFETIETIPDEIVFTLLSIKTRIETHYNLDGRIFPFRFLLYYPLKQGLKHSRQAPIVPGFPTFLLYYPLKQGLKRETVKSA